MALIGQRGLSPEATPRACFAPWPTPPAMKCQAAPDVRLP